MHVGCPTDIKTSLFIALGGFDNNNYWSSTENDNNNAWNQNFNNGNQNNNNKDNNKRVRAVRGFEQDNGMPGIIDSGHPHIVSSILCN